MKMKKDKSNSRLREIVKILNKHKIVGGLTPLKLRLILEDLGPTYIKCGQILSLRTDLLPMEYCKELSLLRDNTSFNLSYEDIEKIIEEELNCKISDVFSTISVEPIASASLAQVHYATLLNKEEVVIKIQHQDLRQVMERDIHLLKKAVNLLAIYPKLNNTFDFESILDELWSVTIDELDFQKEILNTKRFLELNKGIPYITAPKIYENYSTSRMIVMEYINGIKVDDRSTLEEYGYDLKEVCVKLANNYIKQIITDGFFHADPHPGNVYVRDGKIVFMDFGMVGKLSERERQIYRSMIYAIVEGNALELKNTFLAIGTIKGEIDHSKLYTDIEYLLDKYGNTGLVDFDMGEIVSDLIKMSYENNVSFPRGLTILARGAMTIQGVIEILNDDVSIGSIMSEFIKREIITKASPKEEIAKIAHDVYTSTRRSVRIPSQIYNLLNLAIKGQTRAKIDVSLTKELTQKIDYWLTSLMLSLMFIAFVIAACIILPTEIGPILFGIPVLSWALAVIAVIVLFILLIVVFVSLRKKKR